MSVFRRRVKTDPPVPVFTQLIIEGVTKLSQLEIDVNKDWGGYVIKNLGSPVDPNDSLRKTELDSHNVSEAIHGLATGEYLAKTDRADQLVERMRLIKEIVVDVDKTEVEFTGLDIKAHKFYLLVAVIKNPTTSDSRMDIYVEGDEVATNYYAQLIYAGGTSISASRSNAPNLGWVVAGDRTLYVCHIELDPDGYFRFSSLANRKTGGSVDVEQRYGCKTAPITNLTTLKVKGTIANSIGKGSKILLFAGKVE